MGEFIAGLEYFGDIVFRHHHIGSRRIIDDIRVNTDVQHFPLTDILSIFGEEESQFRESECQRQACPYDRIRIIRLVILPEQSGGNIDRYDRSIRLVDIFYHCSKTAGQRTVQAGTEQTVDHDIAVGQYRRNEVGYHFGKFNLLQSEYPLLVHLTIKRKMLGRVEQISFNPVTFVLQ